MIQNAFVGDLLVGSHSVQDTVLAQGVCLLLYQDQDHVIGVMLNRPFQALGKLSVTSATPVAGRPPRLPQAENETSLRTEGSIAASDSAQESDAALFLEGRSLHFGGPLSGPLVAIHSTPGFAEAAAGDGVFMAAERNHLEQLMKATDAPFRLIVGHLGWSVDQLRTEINAGIWHRMPATAEVLATEDGLMWSKVIRRATANSVAAWLGMTDVPPLALLN